MIPQEHKSALSRWLASEGTLIAEEIIWQDDWMGLYRSTKRVDGIEITIEVRASRTENVDSPGVSQ